MRDKWVTTTSDFVPADNECHTCNIDDCNCRCHCDCEWECRKEEKPKCEAAPLGFCPPPKCACSKRKILKEECCHGIRPLPGDSMPTAFVPAYVDTLYDSKTVDGTQLADGVEISSDNCQFTAVYRNCNGCCSDAPTINENACFHVEAAEARVLSAFPSRTLTYADFAINNVNPTPGSVIADGRDNYRVPLSAFNDSIYKQRCVDKCLGSKDAVVIAANGVGVSYMLEYVLCGYVSTEEGTFSFEITMANDEPVMTDNTTSFYVPELCIPKTDCMSPSYLKTSFCFDAEVIAPTLTVNEGGDIVLEDTAIISPRAVVETIVNKKVMVSVGCECRD